VIPIPKEEPLRKECEHFLECVRTGSRPHTSGEDALRVLEVLDACGRSLRHSGTRVPLEQTVPDFYHHPTAVIDEPCEIGKNTKIWHFSHIMRDSVVGSGCNLGQNVVISPGVRIGRNVKIQNNVSVYTGVELEDDVFCGPSMVFTNVVNPRSHVNRRDEYQKTLVKRGATLGANSTVVCGTTIGRYAFVAAGAVVTHDVPDYALVMGVPAKQAGWMCACGVKLNEEKNILRCGSCDSAYEQTDGKCEELAVHAKAAAND
jgi:UDP-2-acetamido-3-amino-2,3-dideoxy-glucuronate N-acetyltransferase